MAKRKRKIAPGAVVGGYEIVRVFRSRGIFDVAAARSPDGDDVVIKTLGRDDEDDLDMAGLLVDEALLLTRLDHPNIRRCIGILREPLAQVLEPVDGGALSGFLQAVPATTGRAFSVARALDIVHLVARALCYLRPLGVVHADLTPENVLIDRAGRVALIDFTFGAWPDKRFVHPIGPMRPKLGYNTPEHWARTPASQITPAADIYQLGLTLWATLAGEEPKLTARAKRNGPLPPAVPLARVRSDVPDEVLGLLAELLTLEPSGRPQADDSLCQRLWDLARRFDDRDA